MKKGLKMQSLASLTSLTALETNQIKYDLLLFIHVFNGGRVRGKMLVNI